MKLTLKNWPPFRDCELELPRFTVIVGQNGAGKTRLIEALTRQQLLPIYEPDREQPLLPLLQAFEKGIYIYKDKPFVFVWEYLAGKMHPKSHKQLAENIRWFMEKHPNMSMVCTCYTPYFVDYVALNEVLVVASDGKESACKFLSEYPAHDRMTVPLGTGEFWGSVGEEWVLK